MLVSGDELKAKLLAQAEAAIDKLLKDTRLHDHMTLSEIEQLVGQPEADFRQAVLEEMIVMQHASPTTCPLCAGKLHNKGKRRKQVVTIRGEAEIERTYYQCQQCGKGYFPPRSAVGSE